jgi:hypothetical protein
VGVPQINNNHCLVRAIRHINGRDRQVLCFGGMMTSWWEIRETQEKKLAAHHCMHQETYTEKPASNSLSYGIVMLENM